MAFLGLVEVGVFKGGFASFVEELEGVAEADAVVVLHELDGVACFAAVGGHAAEEAFAGGDDEVGGVGVVVEWAEAGPVFSFLGEFGASALDEGDDVGGFLDLLDGFVWYSWHVVYLGLSRVCSHATVNDEASSS